MANQKTIGVIGLGSIGMRHAKNLVALGHKVYGLDIDATREAEAVAVGCSEPPIGGDILAECDGIVIASPTREHLAHIGKVVNDSTPLFVEKPIANNIEVSALAYRVSMVGYNLRHHSCVKKTKKWLDADLIGEPLWANLVCAQYSNKPAYLRDGVVLNWASHEIDLALYLLGPAKVMGSSIRTTDGNEDMADFVLQHDNGCRSIHHSDYLTEPEIRQTIIVGSLATIIVDLVSRNAWLRSRHGTIMDHLEGSDSFDENYIEEMQAFIDRIDGKQTIGCTGHEALKVLEICLEVRKQAGLP